MLPPRAEIIDIPTGLPDRRHARARVEARPLLDGAYPIVHHGRLIAKTTPKPISVAIRTMRHWTRGHCPPFRRAISAWPKVYPTPGLLNFAPEAIDLKKSAM